MIRGNRVEFVMSDEEVARLDRDRGGMSRGAWLRKLVMGGVTEDITEVTEGGGEGSVSSGEMEVRDGGAEDVAEWLVERGGKVPNVLVVPEDKREVAVEIGVVDYRKIILEAINDETPDEEVDVGLNAQGRKSLKDKYWRLVEENAGNEEFRKLAEGYGLVEDEVTVYQKEKRDDSRAKETARLSRKTPQRETRAPIPKKDQTYWKGKK